MIDVFVRIWTECEMRTGLAIATVARIGMLPDCRRVLLIAEGKGGCPWGGEQYYLPTERFHIDSKRKAEELAQSPIYCVIDDDCLVYGQDWLKKGCETLANNPEYGMLASWPVNEQIGDCIPGVPLPDVIEMHSIGTPYFVRKGTLTFPDGPKEQYDGILSKVVTHQGLKTGYMPKVQHLHMGSRFSQVIPSHWDA